MTDSFLNGLQYRTFGQGQIHPEYTLTEVKSTEIREGSCNRSIWVTVDILKLSEVYMSWHWKCHTSIGSSGAED